MPFMKGAAPVRRTLKYLESGLLYFQPEIRVLTINYNLDQKASDGAYQFQFWHFPQIKYKNPQLQLLRFKNMTPNPCIQLFFEDGRNLVMDVYGRSREEIHDHLSKSFCRELETLVVKEKNPADFGRGCGRWCICEVPGQVPCPGFTPLPKEMRGKYKMAKRDE